MSFNWFLNKRSGISNVATLENMSMRHSKSLISLKGNHASTGAASQPTFNQQEPQAFHSLSLSVGGRTSNIGSLVKSHFMSILGMPVHLKWLCLTHCFSWMSLLCFSLYFTDFVGDEVYGKDDFQQTLFCLFNNLSSWLHFLKAAIRTTNQISKDTPFTSEAFEWEASVWPFTPFLALFTHSLCAVSLSDSVSKSKTKQTILWGMLN